MDQSLKNRLVGGGVLLLLAVIVLPWLFDGANEQALLSATRMPAPPEVPAANELLAEDTAPLAEAEGAIARDHVPAEPESAVVAPVAVAPAPAVVAPVTSAPVPAAPPAAVPAPSPADPRLAALAEAWDVQLVAVSSPEGAARVRDQLTRAGYKARILSAGNLHKVLVGPELRKADAQALRERIAADKRIGLPPGMLVRYIP